MSTTSKWFDAIREAGNEQRSNLPEDSRSAFVHFDRDLMRTLLRVLCASSDIVTFKDAAKHSGITTNDLRGIRRRNPEFDSVLTWLLCDNRKRAEVFPK